MPRLSAPTVWLSNSDHLALEKLVRRSSTPQQVALRAKIILRSWLNQIELWFSILMRKLLRRASFTSQAQLKRKILEFVAYFNRTMAKPFKWTYKGKPLVA